MWTKELTQEQVSIYYECANDPLYFDEQGSPKNYISETFKNYQKRSSFDIGTNTGLFVKIAQDSGWGATGLEPNKWGVEYAKKIMELI